MADAPDAAPDRDGGARVAVDRLRRFGGDALAREMTAMFAELAAERLAAARDALARGDRDALAHAAHSLRASCGQMGGTAAERSCRELETRAPSGDLASLVALVEQLDGECDTHRRALEREIADGDVADGDIAAGARSS